jgi:DNA-binding MarR family transcriptional regulator
MTAPVAGSRPAAVDATDGSKERGTADLVLEVVPRVMRLIRAEMRGATGSGVSVPQLRALLAVRRQPGTNLSAVAEHLGVGLASASTLVDRLVRQGLLTRVQDPDERRRVRLELTAEGALRLDVARRRASEALAEALASCTAAERSAVRQAMQVLAAATEQGPRT